MRRLLMVITSILFIISCKDDPIQTIEPRSWVNGAFIVNEGAFNHSNATLGWYDFEKNEYEEMQYKKVNNEDLGDVFQSINFVDEQTLLTVNNSDKVLVLESDSLLVNSVFTDVESPRYSLPISNKKVYTTSIKEQSIAVWNPKENTLIKRIPFNGWSEHIIRYKNYAIVSNPSFYSGKPTNHIFIINTDLDQIVDSVEVLTSPGQMVIDHDHKLWVYCQGHFTSGIKGGLAVVDLDALKMIRSYEFQDLNPGYATSMALNSKKDSILFLKIDVFKMSTSQFTLPSVPFIVAAGRTFYGLNVNANDQVWVSDAVDYIQKGVVSIYEPNGVLLNEFRAGVIPSRFYFR